MLTIRTAAHIRGTKSLKGFHSCPASTGILVPDLERSQILRAEAARNARDSRRQWLAQCWDAHLTRIRPRNAPSPPLCAA